MHCWLHNHIHNISTHLHAESVAVDLDNKKLYMLDRYGTLFTAPIPPQNATATALQELESQLKRITYVGPGRPIGYHIHPESKQLIICDSLKGLTSLDLASGHLSVLANEADGRTINYANDLDISHTDGTIYFTDATAIPPALNRDGYYDTMQSYILTALQGSPTGRVLAHNPTTGTTKVVASGLWFVNGIALSQDESYLIFAETPSMRLRKHWLTGSRAGTTEVLLDGLPGFPDGVARASDGNFWVALIVPDLPIQRAVAAGGVVARWLMSWVRLVVPVPMKQWGMVLKVSGKGEVLQVLQDRVGRKISGISGVVEAGGRLYMGHLAKDYVSYIDLENVGGMEAK